MDGTKRAEPSTEQVLLALDDSTAETLHDQQWMEEEELYTYKEDGPMTVGSNTQYLSGGCRTLDEHRGCTYASLSVCSGVGALGYPVSSRCEVLACSVISTSGNVPKSSVLTTGGPSASRCRNWS